MGRQSRRRSGLPPPREGCMWSRRESRARSNGSVVSRERVWPLRTRAVGSAANGARAPRAFSRSRGRSIAPTRRSARSTAGRCGWPMPSRASPAVSTVGPGSRSGSSPRAPLPLQVLVEERHAPLPSVLRRILLVDLGAGRREEGVWRSWIEHELVRRIALLELGFEAPDVVWRNAGVGFAVESQHGHGELVDEAEGVHARRVGERPLHVTVPGHSRGDRRILRREVESERAPAAKARHAQSIRLRPRLLLGVVGGGADIAEILGPGDLTRDLPHLLEILPLHAALAMIELGRDRVEAGLGEAPDDVFVVLVVARDRKSTRLNSSHVRISYAVFCLKKKTK